MKRPEAATIANTHLAAPGTAPNFDLSVVCPVYNEERCLPELLQRLQDVLQKLALRGGFEVLLVDDGSEDRSREIVTQFSQQHPQVRVVELGRNRGQFRALMEGLRRTTGRYVVTLDADLQNPPEEIPRVVEALRAGCDLVTTHRRVRHDALHRRLASRLSNRLSSWIAGTRIPDHGCMLCGFDQALVQRMCQHAESLNFVQALALCFAERPTDLPVSHAPRFHGRSRYDFMDLLRLQMDAALGFRKVRKRWARRESDSTVGKKEVPDR